MAYKFELGLAKLFLSHNELILNQTNVRGLTTHMKCEAKDLEADLPERRFA